MAISGVNVYASQASRALNSATGNAGAASRAGAVTGASGAATRNSGDTVQTTDFTQMTRKDLLDWVNAKIKSGEMSLDGSEAFVAMTIHIPVDGRQTGLDDTEKVDFMQLVRNGIAGARQNRDKDLLDRLQAALDTMQTDQNRVSRVDLTL